MSDIKWSTTRRGVGLFFLGGGTGMEDVKRTFARNLQAAMDAKGMNQSDLARVVFPQSSGPGADGRGNIGAYLAMTSLPTRATLQRIAKALGTTPEALMPASGLPALEQPEVNIEFAGKNRARLKINAVVTTSIALKVAELIESNRTGEE